VVLVSFIANLQLEEGGEEESLIIAKNDLERLEEGCVHRHPPVSELHGAGMRRLTRIT